MEQTQAATAVMLAFSKELPKEIPAGQQVISFERKSTTKNPVADDEKIRYCIAPMFPSVSATMEGSTEPHSTLIVALQAVIDKTASNIMQAHFISTKAEEIPADLLTFAAVVEVLQQKQTAEKLTTEQIAAWYDASKTGQANALRYGPATDKDAQEKSKKLRSKYVSLASGNPNIDQQLAVRMISYVVADDVNHPVCKGVLAKLDKRNKNSNADEL